MNLVLESLKRKRDRFGRTIALGLVLTAFAGTGGSAALAQAVVPGADKLRLNDYFEAPVEAAGVAAPFSARLIEGRLPYGLYFTGSGTKIAGYPTAAGTFEATLRVVGVDGRLTDGAVKFTVDAGRFGLVYKDLPVAKLHEETAVAIEGVGGKAPYSGCGIERARTYFQGAARPGARMKAEDRAPDWVRLTDDCKLIAEPEEEAVVFLLVAARDAEGALAKEFYALRSAADPAEMGWLEQKARWYDREYQDKHSPNGLTLEISEDGGYGGYGDSAMWTGTYLAGAAYYYAVTGEQNARRNVDKALAATTRLREITGVPGLIARAYEHDEWRGRTPSPRFPVDPENHYYEVQNGPLKGWRYLTTASRDQYTGVFWGNGVVFEILDDPDFKRRASENLTGMAAHIWDNRMKIVDPDGKMTKHGLMSGYGISDSEGTTHYDPYLQPIRFENGMNAAMLLNWFNLAAASAPGEADRKLWSARRANLISKKNNPEPGREFEKNYLSLLPKSYVYADWPEGYVEYYRDVRWFNVNLHFNNYFHLIRLERDPEIRAEIRRILTDYFWNDREPMESGCEKPEKRRAGREKSPHFTWQHLAAMGDRDPDKIFDALDQMMAFPYPPRGEFPIVEPIEIESVPGHDDIACEPIPVQYRVPSDYQWQRSPYKIGTTWPSFRGKGAAPGADAITPYWMGRFFGYVPGNI